MLIGIIAGGVLAGIAYIFTPFLIPRLEKHSTALCWVIGIGLALRLLLMGPAPFYEIDFYRYLWDGAVTLSGHSPYQWSPDHVLNGNAPVELTELSRQAIGVIDRINYPHLTTIYPPVAQAIFALASWIEPWSLMVWRGVVLIFELISIVLLLKLLQRFDRSPLWIAVYWWNPIVIVEFSNAAHMDALLLPFLIAAVLLVLKRPASFSSYVCLAFAAAIKLWPVLLFPTLLRPNLHRLRFSLLASAIFMAVASFLMWPFLYMALAPDAGLLNYSQSWERNAAIFHTLLGIAQAVLDHFGLYAFDAGRLVRTVTGVCIALIALGVNWRTPNNQETMIRRIMIIITALLMLGPTLYPWYYTWLTPFLVIVPSRALMAFSIVLPLYRLQFHPWFLDHPWVFENIVVWAEQGIVLVLLLLEKRSRHQRVPLPPAAFPKGVP